jgi:hypothetical protein
MLMKLTPTVNFISDKLAHYFVQKSFFELRLGFEQTFAQKICM